MKNSQWFKHQRVTKILNVIIYPFIIGATLCLSFPPHAISVLIFISMSLFIIGLEKTKAAFWYGYNFYLGAVIFFIGYWFSYYFRSQLDTGYITSYALTSIICFYTALYIGIISFLYVRIKTRFSLFNLTVLFPSLWVLTELIRGFFFPRSWYALGNTQVDTIIFRGYYPLFGDYFVSWLVVAISGLLAWCFLNRSWQSLIRTGFILVTFSIVSYALLSIQYTKPYGKPIKIALLQPSMFSSEDLNYDDLLDIESISAQLVANTSANLIVLPETVFSNDYHNLTPGYLAMLKRLIGPRHEQLIFGAPINWGTEPHQTGILDITHPETPIYLKHYLVPFGEYNPLQDTFLVALTNSIGFNIPNYIPGDYRQKPTEMLGQLFAFNVCYENTINDYVAANAKNATILLNQSDLSWYGKTVMKDASLQFSQARALENQRYFLQDGNTGDTVIINPNGEVEKKIPPFEPGTLVGEIQGYSGTTLFERLYNMPIWLLCWVSLLLAIVLKKMALKHSD